MNRVQYLFLGGLFFFSFLFASCHSSKKHFYETEGMVFHTYYSIKYEAEQPLDSAIEGALNYIDSIANPFNKSSLLYAVNNNLPQWQDKGLIYLFQKALNVYKATGGEYDITVGPLVNIWGFGYESSPYQGGDVPQRALDSLREFIGMDKVWLQGDTLCKEDPRVSIDMASIAKGYASDRVATALEQYGVTNYLVEIGGEISFKGINPQGKSWNIGINTPALDKEGSKNGDLEAILTLTGKGGVATSGNYRNYKVDEKGHLYAHTIDPIEGCPVQRDILSATILAPDCATADALATASMVVGSQKALEMIKDFEGVECFLLVADGRGGYRSLMSEGMKQYISQP